jgi:hypothetical protein
MHKARVIFNAFYAGIYTLKTNALIKDVVKTNIDTEQQFPLISVSIGSDSREDYTKQEHQHNLTLFTDIYVKGSDKSLDDQMLDIRELIENQVLSLDTLDLSYVFKIEFQNQSSPDYNGEGVNYASRTRLEWLIEYYSEINPN